MPVLTHLRSSPQFRIVSALRHRRVSRLLSPGAAIALAYREIFAHLYQAERNPIRHFENIPVTSLKKIVIGDFQPALVHRQVPSIYDAKHIESDGKIWERRK